MIINSIKEKDDIKHFVMYVLIGIVAVGSDNVIFNYLRNFNLSMYVSNFISVNCGLTVSFICNTFINFKKADNLVKRRILFYHWLYWNVHINGIFTLWSNFHKYQRELNKTNIYSNKWINAIYFK